MKSNVLISLIVATSMLVIPAAVFAGGAAFDIKLSPAGAFTGKTPDVKGFVKKVGSKFIGENIVVSLKNIKTGMALRDKHTQEHLGTDKHPDAILVKAEGENGKGKGVIKIRGIEKEVEGTYKVDGKNLVASFPIKLSDFKIEGIRYMGVGVKDQAVVNVNVPIQ